MHTAGMVHGDIKLTNFVYGELPGTNRKDWYLIDLGAASPAGTYWMKRGTLGYYM